MPDKERSDQEESALGCRSLVPRQAVKKKDCEKVGRGWVPDLAGLSMLTPTPHHPPTRHPCPRWFPFFSP